MKINWRVVVAIVVMVGVAAWAVSSATPRSFSGANLTFGVGSGLVTINNPSDVPVAAQLVGSGTRSFAVSSSSEGVSGSSMRQGSGNASTQLFEYPLPPGTSEFTVARGTNVNFLSESETSLSAMVEPLSAGETRTNLIVAALAVLGGLYYLYVSTERGWINILLRRQVPLPVAAAPVVGSPADDPNRGHDGRMYSNYGSKD